MRAVPLADHLAEWSARTGITVRVWALPREPLPAMAAGLAHGMLRDVLEEVERQGSARTVSVALTLTAGRLRLTVSDDGSGTSADAFEAVLRDRRATIAGLGGRLAVNGVRGEGTTISAAVPLT
ncbi:ATP-binding protein [Nonomuraea sp. SBT364]|uniref:ATP-binding protein n=1 Tax=Nonomuraea sp. SBT364 TaxID=1580530 RepID=UPI00066ED593|nr:ATP-binding protein [Nonomuraea sp. SBT364]